VREVRNFVNSAKAFRRERSTFSGGDVPFEQLNYFGGDGPALAAGAGIGIAQNQVGRIELKVQEECICANDSPCKDWEEKEAVLSGGGD
jgi:hypothetical protein